eukprot:CAMPEP_0185367486 /NCGR_PEP_ID=MMETSP1364-20130426/14404_1 /TAXON_ID=38817 /ORGANISM="Gephyrocapsa oceanica, Strain RCC1303" /LENGTH=79 /DNA_ID=CAMNT_0027968129 /DNA_START=62 /DNA_END=298 /DNA_ORIENTATION=-
MPMRLATLAVSHVCRHSRLQEARRNAAAPRALPSSPSVWRLRLPEAAAGVSDELPAVDVLCACHGHVHVHVSVLYMRAF